jgi:hypothetical protein
LLDCEFGVFHVLDLKSEFFVGGFELGVGCFEAEEVLLHGLVLRGHVVDFLCFGSDFFVHFFIFVCVLIGGELGIMLQLLDLKLEFGKDSFIVLEQGLDLIVISIDDHELILKFFRLSFLVFKLIVEFLGLEFLFLNLFLIEIDVL